MRYVFNTYKISQQSDEALLAIDNPFALVVLAAKTAFIAKITKSVIEHDQLLIALKSTILKALHSRDIAPLKIRKIMEFLKFYVNFETKEFSDKFNEEVLLITNKDETMGIEEILLARAEHIGKAEGKLEGKAEGKLEGKVEGKLEGKAEGKLEGKVEGKLEEQTKFVKNLIVQLGLSDEQAAGIAEVAVSFVQKVRTELQTGK